MELGMYDIEIFAFSENGSPQPRVILEGIAQQGSSTTFELEYSSQAGSTLQAKRVATFASTLADINNSLQLGLIDNQGIANSLSKKIQAASDALARGNKQASKNILGAFLSEVAAQTGKHITGVAPKVLTEDAQSLSAQTQ
jgi:hypothetical protein